MAYQQVLQLRAREEKCTRLLQEHYKTLAKDLNIHDILDELFSKNIIDFTLKQSIKKLSTNYEASVMFLDDLYGHFNSERFEGFVDVLKNDDSVACSKHKALARLLVTEEEMERNTQQCEPVSVDNKEGNVQDTLGNDTVQKEQTNSQFHPPPLSEDDQFFNEEEQTADSELPNQSVPDVDVERLGDVTQYTYPANIEEGDESTSDDTPTVEYKHEETTLTEPTQYKGSPSVTTRNVGTGLDASQLGIVCCPCWVSLQSNRQLVTQQGTCKNKQHRQVMLTRGGHDRKIELRSRPVSNSSYSQAGAALCQYYPNCRNGPHCPQAHGKLELAYWNGKLKPEFEKCLDCIWIRNIELMDRHCFRKKEHKDAYQVIVYKDDKKMSLLRIHFPYNVFSMEGKVYKCKHTYEQCTAPDRDACYFPHHKVEEQLWNMWRQKCFNPSSTKVPTASIEKLHKELSQYLEELKSCCTQVSVKVEVKIDSGLKDVQNDSGVNHDTHDLSTNNYKKKFIALIQGERSVHADLLKRCNNQYPLTWYKWKDIRSDHQWYLALIMEQYIADNVRQAATHVILKYGDLTFKAGILPPQRFTHKREPCLIIGFKILENIPPLYSPTYLLSNELRKSGGRLQVAAEFELKHSYFNNLLHAVAKLPECVVEKLVIQHSQKKKSASSTKKLDVDAFKFPEQFALDDEYQLPACKKLLSCPSTRPFIITGPFGTGKTRVIAASALYLLQRERTSRILIATYQRRTADEYIEKYFSEGILNSGLRGVQAIRVLSNSASAGRKLGVYAKKFWMIRPGDLQQCRLIITTFITSMFMKDAGQFTHIFIDEGAQTREPECVATFHNASPQTKIVIAGDHQQVGPKTSVLGEKVREGGLAVSLLERLHDLYQRNHQEAYQAELLTNYRCHSAILRLPSTLFYNCHVKSKADDLPHPLWKYPLQFVFTSLKRQTDWGTDRELREAATMEIKTVKSLVQRCANNWPRSWGEKDLSSLCVMVPTRFAERLWKREVNKTMLSDVTVAVTYDIQGLEYRAVFLCTSEPVNKDCTPFDTVKSLCDPRVFNTIITRSQSLVIAVGNPFRLMKIEKKMHKADEQCWLSYFQRCWESDTLVISNELNENRHNNISEALIAITDIMYSKKLSTLKMIPDLLHSRASREDSISRRYEHSYETTLPRHKIEDVRPFQGWKYYCPDKAEVIPCRSSEDVSKHLSGEGYRLKEISAEYCQATPIDNSKPVIFISGVDNRRVALDGATVHVANDCDSQPRVVAIVKQGDATPAICTVDPAYPNFFLPVKQSRPKMASLAISRDVPKGSVSDPVKGSIAGDSSPMQSVLCYRATSLKCSPRITHSIPFDVAYDLLFVVQPLSWHVRDRFPCGAAVAVFPKASSLQMATDLLQDCHGISDKMVPLSIDGVMSQEHKNVDHRKAIAIEKKDVPTICAFSVEVGHDSYDLKIHFVNVADSLPAPLSVDSITIWHSITEKGHNASQCYPVIPDEVASSLSFSRGKVQRAITLEYKISGDFSKLNRRNLLQQQSGIIVEAKGFTTSTVYCEEILEMPTLDDFLTSLTIGPASRKHVSKNLDIFDKLTILHIAANHLHRERLGHEGYNLPEMDSAEYPEAQKVLNEFIIQTNYQAALKLEGTFPDTVLLKRQSLCPMNTQQLEVTAQNSIVAPSYPLIFPSLDFDCKEALPEELPMKKSTLHDTIAALTDLHVVSLKQSLYKLQYYVLQSISREYLSPEVFCVANMHKFDDQSRKFLQHDIHCLPLYTSFTSPFQCIGDLFVQEGLLAAIRGTEWKRTTEELRVMFNRCNKTATKASEYVNATSDLELAISCQQSSVCVEAYVQQATDKTLKLCYLPPNLPNSGTTRVVEVNLCHVKESGYKIKVKSSDGLISLKSWDTTVHKDSSKASSFGFAPLKESSSLARTSLDVKDPQFVRLSQSLLKSVFDCLGDMANSTAVLVKLNKLLSYDHEQKESHKDKAPCPFVFAALRVPFPVQPYQMSRLWLGCDPTSYVLSVQPQCMELAPDVRVCLQHMQYPLACFTQCPTEVASKLAYNSWTEYKELWQKAVLATSAELGVSSTTSSLVYKDVLLKFPKFVIPPHILTQEMYTPVGEITATFKHSNITSGYDLFTIGEGDLVCARYEVDLMKVQLSNLLRKYQNYILPKDTTVARAVLHMVVRKVTHYDKIMEVKLQATGSHPSVSPLMKEILEKNKFTCELEVIAMPDSLRIPYKLLASNDHLVRKWAPLISEGDLESVRRYTDSEKSNVAQSYPALHPLLEGMLPEEHNAVHLGMRNEFQLIQTPPGTGGERLANTLVFGFALRNKKEGKKGRSGGPQKCVLYCFPNEEMACEAAVSFCNLPGVCSSDGDGIRVLLITSRKVERQHYLILYDDDRVIFDGEFPELPKLDDRYSQYTLHHLIHTKSLYANELKRWEESFNKCCYAKNLPQLSDIAEYDRLTSKAEEEIMSKSFDVIICTCSEASSERIRRYFQPVQVVVYNASMITEPETFSAIHQALHVVLVGDHQQHRPLLSSDVSLQNGMNVSLFERMYRLIERECSGDVEKCPLFVCLKEQEIMYVRKLNEIGKVESNFLTSTFSTFHDMSHEAVLSSNCWIPFGYRSITVDRRGGTYNLCSDGLTKLTVPRNVVQGETAEIRFAIIGKGPFQLPPNHQLGSFVVYVHYNPKEITTPVTLSLPSWYGDVVPGETPPDGLSFAVAPHILGLQDTLYTFQMVDGGEFHDSGVHDLSIDGHSSLFTIVFKEGAKSFYQTIHLIVKNNAEETTHKIYVTYSSLTWSKIVKAIHGKAIFKEIQQFLFEKSPSDTASSKLVGEVEEARGNGWAVAVDGCPELHQTEVSYEQYGFPTAKDLKDAVKEGMYPPKLTFIVANTISRGEQTIPKYVNCTIRGANRPLQFSAYVKERISGSEQRTPHSSAPSVRRSRSPRADDVMDNMSPMTSSSSPSHLPSSLSNKKPSDAALNGILRISPDWSSWIVDLGVPISQVQVLESEHIGGLLALQYWRDGKSGGDFPSNWKFLLDTVNIAKGPEVAQKILEEAKQNETLWCVS